jgi:3-hydroxybutyryl-CoA dehydratase
MNTGDTFSMRIPVTSQKIADFAAVSGDDNPVHFDDEVARAAGFSGRIAHGMLLGSFISAVLGRHFPGKGAIYLSQKLVFRAPVPVPSEVTIRVECTAVRPDKPIATLATTVLSESGAVLLEGEAVVRYVP